MVLTTDREGGREVALVAREARHFGQATTPTSTSHFTTREHGRGNALSIWGLGNAKLGIAPNTNSRQLGREVLELSSWA